MINGWKNRQTWNVSMWLNNEEPWYFSMLNWLHENPAGKYVDMIATLQAESIIGEVTPDGVSWTDPYLDHEALDAMLAETTPVAEL